MATKNDTTMRRVARRVHPLRLAAAVRAQRVLAKPLDQTGEILSPADALAENGFTVFQGLVSPEDCAELSAALKQEADIRVGNEFTRVDSTNKFPTARRVLFDERVLGAVREAVRSDVRFLQVSDLHYLHDTSGWHRDSVHRAKDSSDAADWAGDTYGVVKAILYLESENAGMGIMAGSHLSPLEFDRKLVASIEARGGQIIIDDDVSPNRRLSAEDKRRPLAWHAKAGDLLVFDERMYHAGRRVGDGRVQSDVRAAKFTLSLVFGPENTHSWRLYSYFRYARRELYFKDFSPQFRDELAQHNLLLADLDNYYLQHPQELRLAHLRHPETMDALVEEFTRDGEAARA